IVAILSAIFAAGIPIVVEDIINSSLPSKDGEQLLNAILFWAAVLLGQVITQLLFNYYANLLGESVIRDIRLRLFGKMTSFKMASAAIIMLAVNWKLALIVFAILPLILIATRLFQRAMKVAFIEVRAQVSNLNSFVQERIAGMKIVQLFNREEIEREKFKVINEKHQNAWLKTVWYNSIFFPIAEIANSIGIGLVVYFGLIQNLQDSGLDNQGAIIAFFFLMDLLFRPLRQIADKFNTLQMGMVAANRVFKILDTD